MVYGCQEAGFMIFVIYKDLSSQWRWTLYAANNRKIADSGEAYVNKADAVNGIALVKSTSGGTPVRER
jgi:uncharacterized protein YegP (UPF0339 family)